LSDEFLAAREAVAATHDNLFAMTRVSMEFGLSLIMAGFTVLQIDKLCF